ncbi:hypothetical protein MKW92_033496 [Papaver armeniacum]|nr:hypothetical protein MKW92_033496 [Papaver armeniacum]
MVTSLKMLLKDEYSSSSYYRGGGGGVGGLLLWGWRNEMEEKENREMEDAVFYSLCVCYALISIIALVQLIRIQMRVPEFGWTTQKVFHLMNFIVNGLRAVLFGFYHRVFLVRPKVLEMALLDLPSLLFFSTYALLVLFWAEIYHQVLKFSLLMTINGIVYIVQVTQEISLSLLEFYMHLVCGKIISSSVSVEIAKLFLSVYTLCSDFILAALGFLIYGWLCYGICCTCFLIRCIVVMVTAFDKDVSLDVLNHPMLNLFYYLVNYSSALVLFILRKLPPKRVSDQYHPIS